MSLSPFEIYCEKHGTDDDIKNDESKLREDYKSLSESKLLKYIKKAEKNYDSNESNTNKRPFNTYLSSEELRTLMISYGMAEKTPQNAMQYLIQKAVSDVEDDAALAKEARLNAVKKWTDLGDNEKVTIRDEFTEEITLNYFKFARALPEQRIVDYLAFLKSHPSKTHKKIETNTKSSRTLKNKGYSTPLDLYFEKNSEKYASEHNLFVGKSKASTDFKNLDDKQKIKFIKKAETKFDSSKAVNVENTLQNEKIKNLSDILTKNELKLLLETYEMPTPVPANLSSYFFKKNSDHFKKDHTSDRMKKVFEMYRNLTAAQKQELLDEHSRKLAQYAKEKTYFIEKKLPKQRLVDFNVFTGSLKAVKKNKKASNKTNGTLSEDESIKSHKYSKFLNQIKEYINKQSEVVLRPKKYFRFQFLLKIFQNL
jgi:phosphoribosyl-dephospho-CoA transferase